MSRQIKLNVYGRIILADRIDDGWSLCYVGDEGKSHHADDLVIPDFIDEDELEEYLADIRHEWLKVTPYDHFG